MSAPPAPGGGLAAVDDRPTGRGWLVVALLWAAACSYYMTRNLFVTMHGSIEAAIPMTETQFGLLSSVFLWVYALLNPLGGLLADRFNRSSVIIVSMLAWSAVTLLTAYARTFPQLLILRAIMGISQACYMPSASALVTDYHRGRTRSLATGLHMGGLVVGAILGGLSGWLAESHAWSYSFILFGLPSLAFALVLVCFLRDPLPAAMENETLPGSATRPPRSGAAEGASVAPIRFGAALVSLLSTWSVIAVILLSVLQNAVSWILIGWMPTYLHEHFNLGQGAAGISATAYVYVTQFFSLLLSGFWADRWSRRNVRARLWVPAIGLALAAPSFWLAGHSVMLGSTIVCLCLWGMAVGCMGSNIMPVLCLVSDRRYRATAYGLANGAGAVAGGLAIYGAGVMRDLRIDLSKSLIFAGICAALCSVIFLLINTGEPKGSGQPS